MTNSTAPASTAAAVPATVHGERKPDSSLLTYYLLRSLFFGPAFPAAALYFYFRYSTLRYEFDDEGVSMRWGILFRREISLTYARIQDIHLTSNIAERWLGLARVQIQTASGSSVAEITIEGLPDFEAVRDFLYSRMRRSKTSNASAGHASASTPIAASSATAGAPPAARRVASAVASASPATVDPSGLGLDAAREIVQALRDATVELQALRGELAAARKEES